MGMEPIGTQPAAVTYAAAPVTYAAAPVTYAAAPATYAAAPTSSVVMHDPGAVTYVHHDPAPAVTYAAPPHYAPVTNQLQHELLGGIAFHASAPAVTYAAAPATYAAAPTS